MSRKLKDHEKTREAAKASTQAKFKKMRDKFEASDELVGLPYSPNTDGRLTLAQDKEAEELIDKLSALKDDERKRGKKIKDLEGEISRYEAELANPVKNEKMEDLVTEMVSLAFLYWHGVNLPSFFVLR